MLNDPLRSLLDDTHDPERTLLYEITSAANAAALSRELLVYTLDSLRRLIPFHLGFCVSWTITPPRLLVEPPHRLAQELAAQPPSELFTQLESSDRQAAQTALEKYVHRVLAGFKFPAPLFVPLVSAGTLQGLLVLAGDPHPETHAVWNAYAAHQEFLNEVGVQVGTALHRIAAQVELQTKNARLYDFLNHIEDGYWETDGQGRITYATPAALRTLKRPIEEVRGKRIDELSDADPAGLNRLRERLRRDGIAQDMMLHIRAVDDQVHIIRQTIQATRDDTGKILYHHGIFRDITSEFNTHEQLKRRNQELQLLHQFAVQLNDPLNIETALRKGLELVASFTPMRSSAVFLIDAERTAYGLASHRSLPPQLMSMAAFVPLNPDVFGNEFDSATTDSWMEYLIRHPRTFTLQELRGLSQLDVSSLLTDEYQSGGLVPLRHDNQVYGAILVASPQPYSFDEHDTRLLDNIAAQLGLALHNARTVADLKRQIHQVETVVKTGKLIQSSTQVQETLSRVAGEIRQVFNASYVVLHTLQNNQFTYVAASDTREMQRVFQISPYEQALLANPQPLVVPDVDAPGISAEQRAIMTRLEMRSSIGVRLVVQDRPIGLLFVNQETPRNWQPHEVQLIVAFAQQIGNALETKRLLDTSNHQVRELKALSKVGALISAADPPNQALYAVAEEIVRVFDADYVGFHLRQDNEMHLVAESKETGAPRTLPILPHQLRILEELDPIPVTDSSKDAVHPRQSGFLQQYNLVADLGVPLVSGQKAFGIMYISQHQARDWTTAEIQLAQTFAQQVAGALTTTRLLHETRTQVRDLSALAHSANHITRSRSPEHALPRAAEDLRRLLQADYVGFHLVEGKQLRVITEPHQHSAGTHYAIEHYHNWFLLHLQKSVINDSATDLRDPAYRAALERHGVRASIAVPMISQGRAIGILFVDQLQPRQWLPAEWHLVEAYAQQIAIVLELVQLLADKESQVNALMQLANLNEFTASMLEEEYLTEVAVTELHHFLGSDRTTLLLVRDGKPGERFSSDNILHPDKTAPPSPFMDELLAANRPIIVDPLHPTEFDTLFQKRIEFHNAKSFITVPLITPREKIGLMTFVFHAPHIFPDHEIRLAQAAANQLAIAFVNARLVKAQTLQIAHLTQLSEFGLWCGTMRDSAILENEAVKRIHTMLGMRAASIRLVEGTELTVGVAVGYRMPELRNHRIPIPPRLHRVLEQQKPHAVPNLETDTTASVEWRDRHLREGFGAMLMLPMIVEDQVVGILTLLLDYHHEWTEDEIRFAQALANTVALAISNLKQAEERERNRNELSATLDSVFSGVFTTNNAGIVQSWNDAAEKITGFSKDAMLGKAWHVDGPYHGSARYADEIALEAIAENSVEFGVAPRIFTRSDGNTIQLRVAAAPLRDASGRVRGAVCSFWDRTDEQAAERARIDHINMVAHQLVGKLSAMMWTAEALGNPDLTASQRRRYIDIIKQTKAELQDFSQRFRAFQLEHTERDSDDTSVDLREVVQDTVAERKIMHPERTFRIDGSSYLVLADNMRLTVVLDNLLENACKYSPADSAITLKWRVVQPDKIQLDIHNAGEPIPPELQARLFERWERGDSDQPGSGLGLWLVRTKLREMGGTIEVESTAEQGTTFHIMLRRPPSGLPDPNP